MSIKFLVEVDQTLCLMIFIIIKNSGCLNNAIKIPDKSEASINIEYDVNEIILNRATQYCIFYANGTKRPFKLSSIMTSEA